MNNLRTSTIITAAVLAAFLAACGGGTEGTSQEDQKPGAEAYALAYFELINAGDTRACEIQDPDYEAQRNVLDKDPLIGRPGDCEEVVAGTSKRINGRWHTVEWVDAGDDDRAIIRSSNPSSGPVISTSLSRCTIRLCVVMGTSGLSPGPRMVT
jgi:hypothetical protein